MRKFLLVLGVGVVIACSSIDAQAGTSLKMYAFKEGLKDIVTSPVRVVESTKEQLKVTEGGDMFRGQAVGFVAGVMEGSASMTSQLLKGLVKVITAPVQ